MIDEYFTRPTLGRSNVIVTLHPIDHLHRQWTLEFERKVTSQSKTLKEAVAKYRGRYKRPPPSAFDRWFELAQENNYLLVDEFDTITTSMEPYWRTAPDVIRLRLESILKIRSIMNLRFKDDKASYSPKYYYGSIIGEFLSKYAERKILPDFNCIINLLDEPRVNGLSNESLAQTSSSANISEANITFVDLGKRPVWDKIQSSCPNPSFIIDEKEENEPTLHTLLFIDDIPSSRDVYVTPKIRPLHGFFQSASNLYMTRTLVPILSQCAPPPFNDVLYPSSYYAANVDNGEGDIDKDWDQKLDRLYWTGKSTSGYSRLDNWMKLHRQRLSLMTNPELSSPVSLLRRSATGIWETYQSSWEAISDMFRVTVTGICQCEKAACHEMAAAFPATREPVSESVGGKYASFLLIIYLLTSDP